MPEEKLTVPSGERTNELTDRADRLDPGQHVQLPALSLPAPGGRAVAARKPVPAAKDHGGTPLATLCAKALRFPFLTADKESELFQAWCDHEDKGALSDLISSHLRLVIKIARLYRGYGVPMADLVAEGNIGLMQAMRRFDPKHGARFATYAAWWIRAAMKEYILRAASSVRIGTTTAQRKLFFNLRRLKAEAGWREEGDLTPELTRSIAAKLGVTQDDVIAMDRRLSRVDSSLNAILPGQEGGEWLDTLADERPDQEAALGEAEELAHRRQLLGEAMAKLNSREHEIIVLRQFSEAPPSLSDLGQRFGVSGERVRQVEKRALTKLRKFVHAAGRSLEVGSAVATS